ncbi:MAG: hypothetical protein KME42_15160 [Tildeniella nuda ZEHNDER 1965/U140]|jgi:hypothetical protein|nr:hypothetical protein [Tildeniella nuda ZEHNDER 1965/U140]
METMRQIVQVNSDRKVELTLPDAVEPGLVEIVVVLQPLQPSQTPAAQSINLFGFLPTRIDPLQFQRELRDEWHQ